MENLTDHPPANAFGSGLSYRNFVGYGDGYGCGGNGFGFGYEYGCLGDSGTGSSGNEHSTVGSNGSYSGKVDGASH